MCSAAKFVCCCMGGRDIWTLLSCSTLRATFYSGHWLVQPSVLWCMYHIHIWGIEIKYVNVYEGIHGFDFLMSSIWMTTLTRLDMRFKCAHIQPVGTQTRRISTEPWICLMGTHEKSPFSIIHKDSRQIQHSFAMCEKSNLRQHFKENVFPEKKIRHRRGNTSHGSAKDLCSFLIWHHFRQVCLLFL